jgi:hypothetical protein
VAFGLGLSVFNHARHDNRRGSAEGDPKARVVEAPPVSQPPAAPAEESAGHPAHKETVPDEELQSSVEKLLKSSTLTRGEDIDVNADSGTLTLSGGVSAPLVAQVAQALAETVPGVEKVRNRMTVDQGHPSPFGKWPDLSGIPFLHPPAPGSPEATALGHMLDKGQQALNEDKPEEALGIFGAALGLDPRNKTARRGLEQATRNMARRRPQMPVPPSAPTPLPESARLEWRLAPRSTLVTASCSEASRGSMANDLGAGSPSL